MNLKYALLLPGNIGFEAYMFVQMTQEACIIVFLYCPPAHLCQTISLSVELCDEA